MFSRIVDLYKKLDAEVQRRTAPVDDVASVDMESGLPADLAGDSARPMSERIVMYTEGVLPYIPEH